MTNITTPWILFTASVWLREFLGCNIILGIYTQYPSAYYDGYGGQRAFTRERERGSEIETPRDTLYYTHNIYTDSRDRSPAAAVALLRRIHRPGGGACLIRSSRIFISLGTYRPHARRASLFFASTIITHTYQFITIAVVVVVAVVVGTRDIESYNNLIHWSSATPESVATSVG